MFTTGSGRSASDPTSLFRTTLSAPASGHSLPVAVEMIGFSLGIETYPDMFEIIAAWSTPLVLPERQVSIDQDVEGTCRICYCST
jgi:hypothetical protein